VSGKQSLEKSFHENSEGVSCSDIYWMNQLVTFC